MPNSRQAVLFFDLDGVVIDSKTGIGIGLNIAMKEWGLSPITTSELDYLIGPAFQTTVPSLLTSRNIGTDRTSEFIATYRYHYAEIIRKTPLMPDMKKVLETLGSSWPLAIVTSKPETQTHAVLESTGIIDHFDVIVGAQPDELVKKGVLLARACGLIRDIHGFDPKHERSWIVGDRHHDIDAAVEEGISSIGVLWGYGSLEELRRAGADHIISEPVELLELLQ